MSYSVEKPPIVVESATWCTAPASRFGIESDNVLTGLRFELKNNTGVVVTYAAFKGIVSNSKQFTSKQLLCREFVDGETVEVDYSLSPANVEAMEIETHFETRSGAILGGVIIERIEEGEPWEASAIAKLVRKQRKVAK